MFFIMLEIPHSPSSALDSHKAINYGDYLYRQSIARRKGYDEVLFINPKQNLLETATANIFGVKQNKIFTPPVSGFILLGVVRILLKDYAHVEEIEMYTSQLKDFD